MGLLLGLGWLGRMVGPGFAGHRAWRLDKSNVVAIVLICAGFTAFPSPPTPKGDISEQSLFFGR
jgi:hypothetical protein